MSDMQTKKKITAIILAAGSSTRMKATASKQLARICGESVIHRSARAFCECELVNDIIIACKAEETSEIERELSCGISKPFRIIAGGKSRAESARIAFSLTTNSDYIAIHDAARPLVTVSMIERVISTAIECGAATAACPVTDTLKRTEEGFISSTVARVGMYCAQTPQVFKRELYAAAIASACDDADVTDDNMLLERTGIKVAVVDTGKENFKITEELDLALAEFIIKRRENMSDFRVGHGYDVHRFADGRALVIGGATIPYGKGLLGHSDADVLTHAIMDALLGAAALGDIGRHFPDSDEQFRGICSIELLKKVGKLIAEAGYTVVNIDATVVMQAPKIAPYVNEMVTNIAEALGVDKSAINVKATTEEHLGFTGSGEGAAAHAVATVKSR